MSDKKTEKKQECVQVVVRCRPFNTKEKKENRGNIIGMETASFQISIRNPSKTDHPPKHFTFDAVYDETTQQKAFYEESCYDLVEGVMEGYNGTIFAYGQTGCGKTHTMQGYNDPPELRGVIPHSFDHIFENIKGSVNTAFLVRCCYLEIYNEEVRDLLAVGGSGEKRDKLELKEDASKGVYVKGLTQAVVSDQEGINRLMDQGQKMRTVGATAMNETSSRSHSIFTIVVEINDVDEAGKDHIRVGKLNLVDLAGSERASKTGASGSRLKEGCKINLSLSALGNVISALVDGNGKHIPYRDSKLTRLLQDSLGGNTKTLMVAAISPADYNYEETLSTLRYANRAKNIKNKPKINEDPKDAMLRQYKEEIEALKQQLAASLGAAESSGGGGGQIAAAPTTNVAPLEAGPGVDAPKQASPQQISSFPPPAAASPPASKSEDQSLRGQDIHDPPTYDAIVPAADSAAAAAASAEQTGEVNTTAEIPALQEGVASSGGQGDDEGETAGDGKVDDHQQPEKHAEGTQPVNFNQPAPEVVIQEKVVERVVVEEKVVVQEVEVEVESQKMAEHRRALENYSRAIEEQRNRLGQELETSVIRADVEKQAREEMARKLTALQTKVIGLSSSGQERRRARKPSVAMRGGDTAAGGDGSGGKGGSGSVKSPGSPASEAEMEDPDVIIARRNAEHRRMQAKLRQKRRKETRLELERVRALEEKAEVEKEMADVVGQAEEKERRLNKSLKKLERKLVEARGEIEDLTMEHETEREELLDSIRNQNKELQLWEQVARQLLSSKEIARIWERGEYNEDEQTWVLPRIKPRASYIGDPCKLPLLAPPGAVNGGGSGSGTRASVSSKEGGSAKRRRSVIGSRGGPEDRRPRRAGEETAPKEGGGGVFNDVDKPWESLAGRESGPPRSRGEPADLWDTGGSPTDDYYRGLTPPISPSQSHPRSRRSRGSFVEASDRTSRHTSRPDSASSSAGGWGFSGNGGRGGDVDLPSQEGGGDGSKTDRCPSRQGGTRTGSRTTSGSRLGREYHQQQQQQQQQQGFPLAGQRGDDRPAVPEDSLLRQDPDEAARSFGGDGSSGERIPGTENRSRAKSRRNKTRPSMGGMSGGKELGNQEGHGSKVDWGSGGGEQTTISSGGGGDGGSWRERRPKSKSRRGERGDLATGRRVDEVESAGEPVLLDSALWRGGGGGETDGGAAPPVGGGSDLYDFGG